MIRADLQIARKGLFALPDDLDILRGDVDLGRCAPWRRRRVETCAEHEALGRRQHQLARIHRQRRRHIPGARCERREERVGTGERILRVLLPDRPGLHIEQDGRRAAAAGQRIGHIARRDHSAVRQRLGPSRQRRGAAAGQGDTEGTRQRRVFCRQQRIDPRRQAGDA